MKTNVIASLKKFKTLATVIALNLIVSSGAFAAVTTLTFDNLAPGSQVGSSYAAAGVTFAEGMVITSSASLPSHSGMNLAYSEMGSILANFSLTNVKSVSGYVSGTQLQITAYDANGAVVGQSTLGDGNNILLSVTSTSSAIAGVVISGAELVGLDDFTFETVDAPPPVPMCVAINQNLYSSVSAVALSNYKVAKTASVVRAALLKGISIFDQSLKSDVSNKTLLTQLAVLRAAVDCALKPSTQKSAIMQMIDSLIAKTKAGLC